MIRDRIRIGIPYGDQRFADPLMHSPPPYSRYPFVERLADECVRESHRVVA
jgi:hypothetical protein